MLSLLSHTLLSLHASSDLAHGLLDTIIAKMPEIPERASSKRALDPDDSLESSRDEVMHKVKKLRQNLNVKVSYSAEFVFKKYF